MSDRDSDSAWYDAYVEARAAITVRKARRRPPRLKEYLKRPRLHDRSCHEDYGLSCDGEHASSLRQFATMAISAFIIATFMMQVLFRLPIPVILIPITAAGAWYLVFSPYFVARAVWQAHAEAVLSGRSERDKVQICIAALIAYLRRLKSDTEVEFGLERVEWMMQSAFWLRLRDRIPASSDGSDEVLRGTLLAMSDDCRTLDNRAGQIENLRDGFFQMAEQATAAIKDDFAVGNSGNADAVAARADLLHGVQMIEDELLSVFDPPDDWDEFAEDDGSDDDDGDDSEAVDGPDDTSSPEWMSESIQRAMRDDQFGRLTACREQIAEALLKVCEALDYTHQLLRSHAS